MVHIRQHPITGELLNSREYDFTTKAYQIMTDEEIRMSEERKMRYFHQQTRKFLRELKEFEKHSREVHVGPVKLQVT